MVHLGLVFAVAACGSDEGRAPGELASLPVEVAQAHGVEQALESSCAPTLEVPVTTFAAEAGTGTATIIAGEGCAWTLASTQPWLVVGQGSGIGPASVPFTVAANTGTARTAALTLGATSVTITQNVDVTAPSGTLALNTGLTVTRTRTITLAITASDISGVPSMCVSNTTTCSTFRTFSTTLSWSLPSTGSTAVVRLWFRDGRGNVSPTPLELPLTIDTVPPTDGALTVTVSDKRADLSWSGFTDSGSVTSYRVVFAASATAPTSCTSGTLLYSGADTSFAHTGLTNKSTYSWRVCAVDAAGNTSLGRSATAVIRPETVPPEGSVVINAGALSTRFTAATLTLAATDASPAIQMCVSSATTCTTFEAFSPTKPFTLSTGTGVKTVNVWFRDEWGNTSAVSDSIILDVTAPTNGTVTAQAGNTQVKLNPVNFADANSGLAGYRVLYGTGTAATSCTATGFTVVDFAAADETLVTGLTNGFTYNFRVCARDNAGNLSTGVTTRGKPVPETNPPAGTVTIAGGAAFVNTATVTLQFTASDESAVTQMCVSSATTCTTFEAFAPTKTFTLATGTGTKTVNAWFRDEWGNTSPTPTQISDSITLDVTRPTNGTVTAQAGNAQVKLNPANFADATSGLSGYRVLYGTGAAATSCTATGFTVVDFAATDETLVTGLNNGTAYNFRVCARDVAGNLSTGVTARARPVLETNPPSGTVTIAGGAEFVNTAAVTLQLNPSDESTVTQMCVSSATTCTTFEAFAPTKTFTLATGTGTKTVHAWFRDEWGNTSPTPTQISDSVTLDTTLPVNGTVTAQAGNAQVKLSPVNFGDAHSGLAGYRVLYGTGAAATSCAATGFTVVDFAAADETLVTGLANGSTYNFRVCARDGAGNLSTGVTASARPLPETDPPTGSVTIAAGAAFVNTSAVTLALEASDASAPIQMCVSSAISCTTWEAFSSSKSFTLATGTGPKTVNVWFRDAWGTTTPAPASDSITLDVTAPTNGTVTATPGHRQVSLAMSGFADAHSAIAGYRVLYGTGAAPASCNDTGAFQRIELDAAPQTVVTGLSNGQTYAFRVCALDAVGNMSTGVAVSARPVPETDPPVGSVVVADGAAWVNTPGVTLRLDATDTHLVSQMCIATAITCTAWEPFATTKAFTLPTGAGSKTVYVWFRDEWGNTSSTPVSDTIVLDTTAPTNGTVAVQVDDGSARLNIAGFSDTGSGVDRYRVLYGTAAAPTSCTVTGYTVAEFGATDDTVVDGLTNGSTYNFRVCARDGAGNLSTGVTATARPIPETDPPVGTVAVAGGAAYVKSTAVTLNLDATDESGLSQVCISSATTCTSWVAFSATPSFTLSTGTGLKTVNVWFRDIWGNTTTSPASDTITLDATLPVNGTVRALAAPSSVTLTWSGFSDTPSGIAGYRVAHAGSTAPSTCLQGSVIELDNVTSVVVTNIPSGQMRGFRVCAVDVAGNLSTGATVSATPLAAVCGDGVKAGSEGCDDANAASGDGCSSTCAVESGFTCTGQGVGSCADINECLVDNGSCAADALCTNVPGSRTCACKSGYAGNGLTCADINECTNGTSGCAPDADCANLPGSWTCTCKSGFEGDGTVCEDIDECAAPQVKFTDVYVTDPYGQKIYFFAYDTDPSVRMLYTVDLALGRVIARVPVPEFIWDYETQTGEGLNFGAGLHPMANGDLFTITWNGETAQEELRRLDPLTLDSELVSVFPDVKYTGYTWFTDPTHGRIYFTGYDANGANGRLYGVDVYGTDGREAGSVISSPALPDFVWNGFEEPGSGFNFGAGIHLMEDGDAFTVTWNAAAKREELRTVDLQTLETSFLLALPDVFYTNRHTHDLSSGEIYFEGFDADGQNPRLYRISTDEPAVLGSIPFPEFRWDGNEGEGFNFGAGLHVMADGSAYTVTWNAGEAREEVRTVDLHTLETEFLLATDENADDCALVAACENTEGSFTCTCPELYEGDGTTCTPIPLMVERFEADPASLPLGGGDVTLCWDVTGAQQCYVTLWDTGEFVDGEDCITVDDVSSSTDAWLSCVGPAGEIYEQLLIPVGPTIVDLTATPDALPAGGGDVVVQWRAVQVDGCILTRDGAQVASGTTGEATVQVTEDATFQLSCSAPSGDITREQRVTVGPNIRGLEGWFSDSGTYHGWSSVFTESCTLVVNDGSEPQTFTDLPSSGDLWVETSPDAANVTVALTCVDAAGTSVTLERVIGRALIRSFTATPDMLPEGGGAVELSWTSANIELCILYSHDDWQEVPSSGTASVTIADDTWFSLECYGSEWGGVSRGLVVLVGPTITRFDVAPTALFSGGSVDVSWSSVMVESCALTVNDEPVFLESSGAEGAVTVDVDVTSTFTLTCTDGAHEVSQSRTVHVGAFIEHLYTEIWGTQLYTQWGSVFTTSCSLTVNDGLTTQTFEGLSPWEGRSTEIAPGSASITVVVDCLSEDGVTHAVEERVLPRVAITSFVATPSFLPEGGGDVSVCWTSVNADSCVFLGPEGWQQVETSTCATVAIADDAQLELHCSGPNNDPSVSLVVPVGPTITRFDVDPLHLPEPGTVTVTWDSVLVESCELKLDDDVIAAELHGATTVELESTATLTLTCTDGETELVRSHTAHVGAFINHLHVSLWSQDELYLSWGSTFTSDCSVTINDGTNPQTFDAVGTWNGGWLPIEANAPVVTVTLDCVGEDGTTHVTAERTATRTVITSFTATPSALPQDGGEVELCWTSANADACYVPQINGWEPMAPAGCVSTTIADDASFELYCQRGDSYAHRYLLLPVGPTITHFEVSPPHLPGPGTVEVSWTTVTTNACELTRNDQVISEELSGSMALELASTATFALSCTDGENDVSQTRTVSVGALIEYLQVDLSGPNVYAWWGSRYTSTCSVEIDAGTATQNITGRGSWDSVHATFDREVASATVRLDCLGEDGTTHVTAERTVTQTLITSFTATPSALPQGGGEVELCWTSANADACYVPQINGWEPMAPGGCVSTTITDDASFELYCLRGDSYAHRYLLLPVGPTITRFDVSASHLPGPGTVEVSWSTVKTDACELTLDGLVMSEELNGQMALELASTATFALSCTDGENDVSQTRTVSVGAFIEYFQVELSGPHVYAWWGSRYTSACSVEVDDGTATQTFADRGPWDGIQATLATDVASATVRLDCLGEDGLSHVVEERVVSRTVITSFTASASSLPQGGGALDVCWTSENADSCYLSDSPWWWGGTEVEPSGCATLNITDDTNVSLRCVGPGEDPTRTLHIPVGPTITRFEVSPSDLREPGEVEVTWATVTTEDCILSVDGETVSNDLSGTVTFDVQVTTELTLACTDGENEVTRSHTVHVGPFINDLHVSLWSHDQLYVWWGSTFTQTCSVTMDDGVDAKEFNDLGTSNGFPISFDPMAPSITVTLDCLGEDGLTHVFEERVVPRTVITSFVATPDMLPEGGGDVSVCWTSENAEACYLHGSVGWQQVTPSDCASFTVTDDATVHLECHGPSWSWQETLFVPVGPTITRFDVSPSELREPGSVQVTWSSVMVDACALTVNGVVVSNDLNGSLGLELTSTAEVHLDCTDGTRDVSDSHTVHVGPFINHFNVNRSGPWVYIQWGSTFTSSCAVEVNDGTQTHLLDEGGPWGWSSQQFDAGVTDVTVNLTCTDDDGTLVTDMRTIEPDSDGDGVVNAIDLCPEVADGEQRDADEDGIGDQCDPDPGYIRIDYPEEVVEVRRGSVSGEVFWNGELVPSDARLLVSTVPWSTDTWVSSEASYRLPGIPEGEYLVRVGTDGCVSESSILEVEAVTVLPEHDAVVNFDITATAGRVTGTVRINGAPARHAHVGVDGQCNGWGTGDAGTFAGLLPAGERTLHYYSPHGTYLGGTTVTVVAGETTVVPDADFSLGTITGQVLWNGQPVTSWGSLQVSSRPTYVSSSLSAGATFQLASLPLGTHTIRADISSCGWESERLASRDVELTTAAEVVTADLDITSTAGRMAGQIFMNDAPAAHPYLTVDGACEGFYADQNGAFDRLLPVGERTVYVHTHNGILLGTFLVTIEPGTTTVVPRFDFSAGSITGRVLWKNAPVPNGVPLFVGTTSMHLGTYLGSSGGYQFAPITTGEHQVALYQNGCAQQEGLLGEQIVAVGAGVTATADFDITATAGKVIGLITANGAPAPYPQISVSGLCGNWKSRSDGTFEHFLPPGFYVAQVHTYYGTFLGEFEFTIIAGQTTLLNGDEPNPDACALGNGGCDPLTTCTNNPGALPTCGLCPDGFTGTGETGCVQVGGEGEGEGEQCDDGNGISNDGCSSSGVVESGYVCPELGEPCMVNRALQDLSMLARLQATFSATADGVGADVVVPLLTDSIVDLRVYSTATSRTDVSFLGCTAAQSSLDDNGTLVRVSCPDEARRIGYNNLFEGDGLEIVALGTAPAGTPLVHHVVSGQTSIGDIGSTSEYARADFVAPLASEEVVAHGGFMATVDGQSKSSLLSEDCPTFVGAMDFDETHFEVLCQNGLTHPEGTSAEMHYWTLSSGAGETTAGYVSASVPVQDLGGNITGAEVRFQVPFAQVADVRFALVSSEESTVVRTDALSRACETGVSSIGSGGTTAYLRCEDALSDVDLIVAHVFTTSGSAGLGEGEGEGELSACAVGEHDGGDGACVAVGTCSLGYHEGGAGVCVPTSMCSAHFVHAGDGTCVANSCEDSALVAVMVSSSGSPYPIRTAAAAMPNGGFTVAHTVMSGDNSTSHLYVRRFDSALAPVSDDIHVASAGPSAGGGLAITALSAGGFVVAQGGGGVTLYDDQAMESRHLALGTLWAPALAADDGGSFFLATRVDDAIRVQKFDANGDPLSTDAIVGDGLYPARPINDGAPLIVALEDGGAAVVWDRLQLTDSGFVRSIMGARVDASGTTHAPAVELGMSSSASAASITRLVDGGFVLVSTQGPQVVAQRYGADLAPIDAEAVVNVTPFSGSAPAVTGTDDGGFVVFWQAVHTDTNGAAVFEPYYRRYSSTGMPLGVETNISAIDSVCPGCPGYASGGTIAWAPSTAGAAFWPVQGEGGWQTYGVLFNAGSGTCTVNGGCSAGEHDGGDGVCVAVGTCSTGYHDGGGGVCVLEGTCSIADPTDGWLTRAGGAGNDVGSSIAVLSDGASIVAGTFEASGDLGQTMLQSTGGVGAFIARLTAAGTHAWVTQVDGRVSSGSVDVAALSDGSSIVTGTFHGYEGEPVTTVRFGDITLTSAGATDVFIAKLNADGTYAWAQQAGGSLEEYSGDITTFSDGSSVVTGWFTGTAHFGDLSLTSEGGWDVFVAKLSADGTYAWATQVGGTLGTFEPAIASLPDGSTLVTGTFEGSARFGEISLMSSGGCDVFIAKLDANGDFIWATRAGGSDWDVSHRAATLADGASLITGHFAGTAQFGEITLVSDGPYDIFVAKLRADGSFAWATRAGGSGSDRGYGIAALDDGSSIVTGYIIGTAAFGSISLEPSNALARDLFVAKLDSDGSFVWAISGGGAVEDVGRDVAAFSDGSPIVIGESAQVAAFGATNIESAGAQDIVVAKLRPDGSWNDGYHVSADGTCLLNGQ